MNHTASYPAGEARNRLGRSEKVGPRLRDIPVGEVTSAKLKAWLDGNRLEELASAYAVTDNFRTRRVIIDKVGETFSPLSVACMIKILSLTHDETLANHITKKLLSFDADLLSQELIYDGYDSKTRAAVVSVLAALKTETSVGPLTLALADSDSNVRAIAITGLADMIEPSAEWTEHLVKVIKTDKEPSVRLAAAKGLQITDTPEAFQALDQLARANAALDDGVRKIHEAMTVKFRSGQIDKRMAMLQDTQKSIRAKNAATAGAGSRMDVRMILMGLLSLGILVSVLGIVFVWAKHMVHPAPPIKFRERLTPEEGERVRKKTQEDIDNWRKQMDALAAAQGVGQKSQPKK